MAFDCAKALPSAPVSVKALRYASTASAALCGLDRHLHSGWWPDMRSMRFSILKRIRLPECFRGQRATVQHLGTGAQRHFDIFG